MNKSQSSATIITNTKTNNFNEEVEYENCDGSQYVAMDNLGDDANHYDATENPYDDDRDTDSETDAVGENTEALEIYGNAKGKRQ